MLYSCGSGMKTSGPAVQIIPEANLDPRKIVIKSVDWTAVRP
jgi:hypothetical protein